MARWNIRARVIDLGVVETGSDFVTYNGVKVALPDGERRFLGKVIMHNEVHFVLTETRGEIVQLCFTGCRGKEPALLYGMKTAQETVHREETPYPANKTALVLGVLVMLPFCLPLVGFPLLAIYLLIWLHFRRWNPPAGKAFEFDVPDGTGLTASGEGAFGRKPVTARA